MRMGLTVPELACMVGVSKCTIYAIEGGSVPRISHSLQQRIAAVFHCDSVRDVFPGTDCPEISQQDLRAHKPRYLAADEPGVAKLREQLADNPPDALPLRPGDKVLVRVYDQLHERPFEGKVLQATRKLFVVRHPLGYKECFLWSDLADGRVVIPSEPTGKAGDA